MYGRIVGRWVGSVRVKRVRSSEGRRRLQRWVAAALAGTLLSLTAAAVLGSWRQFVIVESMALDSTSTDAYQRAVYLAARELGLLQGALREPGGEEHLGAQSIGRDVTAALDTMRLSGAGAGEADAERGELEGQVAQQRRALQPAITRYLNLIGDGELTAAQDVLEDEIEPAYDEMLETLIEQQDEHVAEYAANMAAAKRDSRVLLLGTIMSFLLGLAVLGVLGWSSRSHRRLIERMAAHDSLTGLCNRAAFAARAEISFARATVDRPQPTVLVLDLDGFKDVNDSLGHHIGDLLLIEVAQRLRGSVRPNDTVARLGGDEFAVLLTDADPVAGELAAVRITQAFNSPFVIDGVVLDIETSIGIATAESGNDVATVLRHADTAMYAAKEHRLGHTRFDPKRAHDTADRLTMLGDLRRALDSENEIELHYQPKVAVDSGDLIGAEALARWRHPAKGMIGPDTFIPVLEGTSLIHRFTARVLDMALTQGRAWLDAGHRIPVAVNVSTRCLLDTSFPDTVARALHKADVAGDLLCIEITENTVMADPERAIDVLRRVRALGVKTAIDDFGTGYSSMAYLKILPVDEIKVDRSFVRDMATDRNNYILVESAVDLGHNLGLAVVAEGVENEPIVTALRELGCDVAQGYHYARPLTSADFTEFLGRREVQVTG
jgi:diguanylate cyclase (GGDEF)-like protein